ncbi:DUF4870 domain-containing protein [Teredinibacter haidensis]|uniref:DUF4870 domain-containing protein n=1 Tax=Teredinibacter haidensis TaxID=2731755 RepID=UPI000948B096|nr:DUF4870 domain-containing protein [Teredinibacter haidensis]
MASGNQRNEIAMLGHLSAFASFILPFGGVLGPLFVYLWKRNESDFVRAHASESFNFQLSLLIFSFIYIAVCIAFVVIAGLELSVLAIVAMAMMFLLVTVVDIVCIVIGSIRASKGEYYRYPLGFRFVS